MHFFSPVISPEKIAFRPKSSPSGTISSYETELLNSECSLLPKQAPASLSMSLEKPVLRMASPPIVSGGGADPTPNHLPIQSSCLNTPTVTLDAQTWNLPLMVESNVADPSHNTGLDQDAPVNTTAMETTDNLFDFDASALDSSSFPVDSEPQILYMDNIPVVFEDMPLDLADPDPALSLESFSADTVPTNEITTGAVTLETPGSQQPIIVTVAAASEEPQSQQESFATNPMACFNPLDVEGKYLENLLVKQEPETPPPAKRNKKDLRLIMPDAVASQPVEPESSMIDTPAIEKVLD